ncbi:MAG: CesT family type III secretion system chaperone [Ramlibacter sp.]
MTISDFHNLAAQFCADCDAPVPDLSPDGDGVLSFSAVVRDVHVAAAHDPVMHPGLVFVYATFGPVPPQHELDICRALLYANLLMLRPAAPVFTRNPDDGQVILRYIRPLADLSGSALWEGVQTMVDSALQWREDHFLKPDTHTRPHATFTPYAHALNQLS